eukprot:TRINITY_DN22387_c0_g3_i1.p1 TRINITY_DN22387_c0_g3~~TRINITY_DN22387_c0_g3_i1.p1  ORF type:complete len:623 (+),score=125.21 TRINITY_DN22387_c0_g3_i1:89-1870(+)
MIQGKDVAGASPDFYKLLQAVIEQYEFDLNDAMERSKRESMKRESSRHSQRESSRHSQYSHHEARLSTVSAEEMPRRISQISSALGSALPEPLMGSPETGLSANGNHQQESPMSLAVPGTPIALKLPHVANDEELPSAWLEPRPPDADDARKFPEETVPETFDPEAGQSERTSSKDSKRFRNSRLEERIKEGKTLRGFIKSGAFDRISALLLMSNAVFIGIQVENSFAGKPPFWVEVIDYVFCVLFIIELAARIWGFGCSHFWCNKEDRKWNHFDFYIVLLSTVDAVISLVSAGNDSPLGNVSVLRVIRIVRITRVLRIIRVMKFFKDLRILVSAIASTLKTASFALLLIFFTIYIFGIAITQLVSEHIKESALQGNPVPLDDDMYVFFGSILWTMFSLFMTIAGGIDWKDASDPLFKVGGIAVFFYLLYVLLMVFCVMNVLTGMFCESAIDTAASDRENVIQIQLQEKHRFVETLQMMFNEMDEEHQGKLLLDHFKAHLEKEHMQALLRSLEIEVRDAITLFELLDADGSGEVDIDEFVTGCITLRGGAKAVHMEKVSNMNKIFTQRFDRLEEAIEQIASCSKPQYIPCDIA